METTTIVQIAVMIFSFGFASGMVMMVFIIKYAKVEDEEYHSKIKETDLPTVPRLIRSDVKKAIQRANEARKKSKESIDDCYSDSNLKDWLEDAKSSGLIKNTGRFNQN